MKTYRYVTLDPTGNTTCLVLDRADPEDEKALTRELLKECEQVAYLDGAAYPFAAASVRLMGGEFCGNAAMAAAAWLLRDDMEPGTEKSLFLDMSGAAEPVFCTVRQGEDGPEGTVEMPAIREIRKTELCGRAFTLVRMDGIAHLVCGEALPDRETAEELLRRAAAELPDNAVGLLQWNPERRYLLPLVFVRGSGSTVWERGCGSGSAAVGAAEALKAGTGQMTVRVEQPGGVIGVTVEEENGRILSVKISGKIRIGKEKSIRIG